MLSFAKREQKNLNNVNMATLMSQLGSIPGLMITNDPDFVAFMEVLVRRIEDRGLSWIKPREASNIIHSLAKLKLRNNPSAKKLLEWISSPETASKFVAEAEPQAVANVAWACATLFFPAPHLFTEIDRHAAWLVEKGTPQEVANTVWACAALDFREAPSLLEEINRHSKWLVQQGSTQAVANTASACAKLGFQAAELFDEIDSQSQRLVDRGNPQDLANTAWACATLGHAAPNWFARIDQRASWLVEHGKSQEVTITAWACASLGCRVPNLFSEIERQPRRVLDRGNQQDVSNVAWACATIGFEAPKMFEEINRLAKSFVLNAKPQSVANTAWAFASLGYEAGELFAEIDRQSSQRVVIEGTPQNISNTAWACAQLGFDAPTLFAEINQHPDRLLKDGNPQNLVNACYAISIVGRTRQCETSLKALWERSIELFASGADFLDLNLQQLAQTQIFAEADGVFLQQTPATMAMRMKSALKTMEDNEVSHSSKIVSQLLNEIGFHHECEVAPDSSLTGGMLAIDFACTEQKVAIEYDGPSHFLKALGSGELTSTENGGTKAKRRFLEQLGWTVINMDYRDLMRAQNESMEKGWLREKLVAEGVSFSTSYK